MGTNLSFRSFEGKGAQSAGASGSGETRNENGEEAKAVSVDWRLVAVWWWGLEPFTWNCGGGEAGSLL